MLELLKKTKAAIEQADCVHEVISLDKVCQELSEAISELEEKKIDYETNWNKLKKLMDSHEGEKTGAAWDLKQAVKDIMELAESGYDIYNE